MPKKTQTKTVEKQQDEHAAHMEKRCRYIEQRLKIVRGNGGYFVVAVPGLKDGPCDILYGPLECANAAEFARDEVVEMLDENGHAYGSSKVTNAYLSELGNMLTFLRGFYSAEKLWPTAGSGPSDGFDSSKRLAKELVTWRPWQWRPNGPPEMDSETPF